MQIASEASPNADIRPLGIICILACALALSCGDGVTPVTEFDFGSDTSSDALASDVDENVDAPDQEQDVSDAAAPDSGLDSSPDSTDDTTADTSDDTTEDVAPDTNDVEPDLEAPTGCQSYGTPTERGVLPSSIDEASGMVETSASDNVFWLHNDSGDTATLYAVRGSDGALLTTVNLEDANARDWEDISRGPCNDPEEECLYVGDFGDNDLMYDTVLIYRLPEPRLNPSVQTEDDFEVMTASYPDGRHNAEALLVDESGAIYILTKEESQFRIYRSDFAAGSGTTLTRVSGSVDLSSLPFEDIELITGGDYDPEARRIVLRTYSSILEYQLQDGQTIDDIIGLSWTALPVAFENQGESIAYTSDGYWFVSEGDQPPFHHVDCQD